jgi:hypothetical protein
VRAPLRTSDCLLVMERTQPTPRRPAMS